MRLLAAWTLIATLATAVSCSTPTKKITTDPTTLPDELALLRAERMLSPVDTIRADDPDLIPADSLVFHVGKLWKICDDAGEPELPGRVVRAIRNMAFWEGLLEANESYWVRADKWRFILMDGKPRPRKHPVEWGEWYLGLTDYDRAFFRTQMRHALEATGDYSIRAVPESMSWDPETDTWFYIPPDSIP